MFKKKNTFVLAVVIIIMLTASISRINKKYAGDLMPKPISFHLYVVKPGDTLSEISEKYKPKNWRTAKFMQNIQQYNEIRNIHNLIAGKNLRIPVYDEKY